jgi:hypothetical protein
MVAIAVGFVALPLLQSNRKRVLAVVVIMIPLVAGGFYLQFGSPEAAGNGTRSAPPEAAAMSTSSNAAGDKIGSVASLVDGLADRLRENPDDGSSWLLLAKSYKHLNQPADAADAYEKAAALGEYDAELAALVSGAAEAQPAGAQIVGDVQLSSAAAAIVEPTDTVFIFAKAMDGPAAPVAVLKRQAADLPLTFALNDSQSMMPGVKLSDFDEVVVTARITRGGEPTAALQGLEAKSDPVLVAGNRHLNLIIE